MKNSKIFLAVILSLSIIVSCACIASFAAPEISTVSSFVKNEKAGAVVTFSESDFITDLSGDNTLDAIMISSLPAEGKLMLDGSDLKSGDIVYFDNISKLTFVPEEGKGEVDDTFCFIPIFSKMGSGSEEIPVTISLSDRQNYAPIAVNATYKTYADIKLCGTLSALDIDGDECIFTVTKAPKKGSVSIDGESFEYEPKANKTGKDTFKFTATDSRGNISAEATVTIDIVKSASKKVSAYSDMQYSEAHFAALYLKEKNIMCGETFGEESFFYPDQEVTRAQFVALVAKISDMALPTVSVGTGLSDNEDIPVWARPYIAAAINSGAVNGEIGEDGNKVFRANDIITRAEAAAILDRAINLANDSRELSFSDNDSIPSWAEQSIINTASSGILSVYSDNSVRAGDTVTREDLAKMLYGAVSYIENQKDSRSFWEKLFN